MQGEDNIFQCPYCGHEFNQSNRRPMILCMSQHTSCEQCVQLLFRGVNKLSDLIDCPFRCGKIKYGDIQNFRYLNEIMETKENLNRTKSMIRKQMNGVNNDKKKLLEELQKQREKNEWLIQLNQKRQNSQSGALKGLLQQIKGQMESERLLLQKTFQKAFSEMQRRSKATLETGLNQLKKSDTIRNNKLQEANESQIKLLKTIEKKMSGIDNQLEAQQTQLKNIKKQLHNSEKIKETLNKISNCQELSLKIAKAVKQQIKTLLKDIQNNRKSNKQEKTEDIKINQSNKNPTTKKNGQIKLQKQLDIKYNLKFNEKDINLRPATQRSEQPIFQKKQRLPDKIYQAKFQQAIGPEDKCMPRQASKNKNFLKKQQKIQTRQRINTQNSFSIKTEPDEKIIYANQKPNQKGNKNDLMRASWAPSMFQNANIQKNLISPRNQKQYAFPPRMQIKGYKNYQSMKNLNSGNISFLQQSKAQQQKISSIIQHLKKQYGNTRISGKSSAIRNFIDQNIHLSTDQIIRKLTDAKIP